MRQMRALAVVLLFLVLQPLAQAEELAFVPLLCAGQGTELVAEGTVDAKAPVTLVLRIDDSKSSGYATRVNLERQLPPGPFSWHVPLAGLKSSGGKQLDTCAITKAILFIGAGEGTLTLRRFGTEAGLLKPDGVIARDFGPEGSPVFPGFDQMTESDVMVLGWNAKPVRRPGPDALTGDGLGNLGLLRFAVRPGAYRVTLWTEDPGEWETLPHPFRRSIAINGNTVLNENRTPAEWVSARYLLGRSRPYRSGQTAWEALGRHRGGKVAADVEAPDGYIDINVDGDGPAGTFLAGLVIEPAGGSFAAETEARRERDYNELWRILPPQQSGSAILLNEQAEDIPPLPLAADTGAALSFRLDPHLVPAGTALRLASGRQSGLKALLWKAVPHLVRNSGGTSLNVTDRWLFAIPPQGGTISAQDRFVIWVEADAAAPVGPASIALELVSGSGFRTVEIPVEILPVRLPPAAKPVGYYLDEAPHLAWGENAADDRATQLDCDLAFLARLGINANAPGLATPDRAGFEAFSDDVERVRHAGNAVPALAYTPAKRLFARDETAFPLAMLAANAAARSAGEPGLVWSLADEPSNPDSPQGRLLATAPALKALDPNIRLAGHFNHKGDETFIGALDTVLVNPGFGVDPKDLERVPAEKEIWFYNMDHPRLAAGLFLAHSRASRYLQWHARMPTADPFDPTDGREGDFQMLLPSADTCPGQPDIDEDLLDMAEGLVDQRWMEWLDRQQATPARGLAGKWAKMAGLPWRDLIAAPDLPMRFRRDVSDLARSLKGIP